MESTFFAELPKELLQEIFLYLNRRDLRTIEEIFNEVLNDNFWIAYFKWDPQDYHRYIKISKVDTYFQRNVMYLNTKDDIDHKKKKFLAYGNTLGFTISNNKYFEKYNLLIPETLKQINKNLRALENEMIDIKCLNINDTNGNNYTIGIYFSCDERNLDILPKGSFKTVLSSYVLLDTLQLNDSELTDFLKKLYFNFNC